MFVSQENINKKKKFKKPNILRKKPKVPVLKHNNLFDVLEPPDIKLQVNLKSEQDKNPFEGIKDFNIDPQDKPDSTNGLVDIDTYLNASAAENVIYSIDYDSEKSTVVFIDSKPTANGRQEIENSPLSGMLSMSGVTTEYQTQNSVLNSSIGFSIPAAIAKFKCDVPNCYKEFRSEYNLKRHKNIHNEDGSIRAPRQISVECPVKKNTSDRSEQPCGKIFLVREQLMKHLNEDHNPDDAAYRCEECGRQFFWASGLRAHARAHCRRAEREAAGTAGDGLLPCVWPGCGRVFRQPCRLREHARAHTGDRPYPCQYPGCSWSFRSASKLVRHARRHTGERRHACGACGRAFLRREHLRDHTTRHHAPRHARVRRLCTYDGCEQTFSNMSTLYLHMKKMHKAKEEAPCTETAAPTSAPALSPPPVLNIAPADALEFNALEPDHTFMVNFEADGSLVPESLALEEEEMDSGPNQLVADGDVCDEWHSARTHCTWPLPPRPAADFAENVEDSAVLEEDIIAEQSEASESNIFTVRSDLFLHGNVLINEDSEHMGSGSGAAGGAGCGVALDSDLGLLDAHPNIDLMQEELMYTDVAADESSFRIFLLSGEELT